VVGAGHLQPGGQNPVYDKPGGAHNSVLPIIGNPSCSGSESVGVGRGPSEGDSTSEANS